ncbi:MAG: putative Ig domain-containing protein [Gemmataceae bacterium]
METTTVEANETFALNLSGATNASISDAQAVGTITNDDSTAIAIGDTSVTEGNSGTKPLNFTVTLTAPSDFPVTVNYATADGTALAASDYVAASGTVTFNTGETSKTISITINGDTTVEVDETFALNLSGATNASISDAQAVGTITNDDIAPKAPTFTSVASATFSAQQTNSFTFTTTGVPTATLTPTGVLPEGVLFHDNGNGTATLSGIPGPSIGTFNFTVTANNGVGSPATQTFVLKMVDPPQITSANTAVFTVGTAGSFTVTKIPGLPTTTTLKLTGTLPSGVSFSTSTGKFSGTPGTGTAGSYPLTITASNGLSSTVQNLTLQVNGPATATKITTVAKATFTVGQAGTFTIGSKGFPFATYAPVTLPAGLSLTDNGNGTATISGTPQTGTGGVYPITITAHNSSGPDAVQAFTLTVVSPPVITSANTAVFTVGTAGSFTVTKTAGVPTTTTLKLTGTLPSGVSFSTSTGKFSGTPGTGTAGSYPLTITASNGLSSTVQNFTLQVNGPATAPTILSATQAKFVVGQAGTFTVGSKGFPFATFSSTALPAGLTLTDNGNGTATISGTPQTGSSGTKSVTITATNGSGVATKLISFVVNQPPAIITSSTTTFSKGSLNTFTVSTTGFPVAALTKTGTLPSGVTFTNNGNGTATLKGTPTVPGTYLFTITGTGTGQPKAIQLFTLVVT